MRLHLNLIFIVLLFRMLMTSIKRWGKCKSDIRLLSVILILIWKFYSCGHEIVQTEPVKVRGIQSGEEDRGRGIPHQPPGDRRCHQGHIQGEKVLRSQLPCSLVLIHHITLYLLIYSLFCKNNQMRRLIRSSMLFLINNLKLMLWKKRQKCREGR